MDLMVVHKPGIAESSRVGITVSRKVGGAVRRNKVKRWLREAIRSESARLHGVHDVVIIAHPSAATAGLQRLQAQVAQTLSKVGGVR
jgi:ribonuclease P protein component